MRLGPADVRGVFGIVPTPASPDAESWRTTDSLNLPETQRMVDLVVDAGVDAVLTTGTFAECATLTEDELRRFVGCVVDTVKGRLPVFAGVTTLNTRDTIARGRRLAELGADGLFVGRPMWLAMDDAAIVRYYGDIAEALPDVALIVYDNPPAFKGKISTAVYEQLAAIPQVVAAKHTGGPQLEADMLAVGAGLRVLPNAPDWYAIARTQPDLAAACWSGAVACAPAVMVALAAAIRDRDWEVAERISGQIAWAEEAMFMGGDLADFINYSIQLGHARFEHAGLIDIGPCRPPYLSAPPERLAGSAECGRRWAQLQHEHAG